VVIKVGLYDVDSKIPNLALMRLSTFHRSKGDAVELYSSIMHRTYDKIYASTIFQFSDKSYLRDNMIVGGTGWDLKTKLPSEIEKLPPDYSLYKYPHNIGFTARGCRLKCKFCVVPQKEGTPFATNTIPQLWTQRDSNFLVLLDNDFFGNPEWRDRVGEMNDLNLRVNFSQGLNIRNLKEEQALALASVKFRNLQNKASQVYFAWDDPRHEKLIHRGIARCVEAGIKPWKMAFYVLIGFHSTPEEDLHRVETLRGYGCDPYVMAFNKSDPYQNRFARWVNRKAIFNSIPWNEYRSGVKK